MNFDYGVVFGCPRSGTTFLINCLEALSYTECLSGISFPSPIIHLAAQPLSNATKKCLEYSFESSLKVYVDAHAGSRVRAIQRLLDGSLSFREAREIFQRQHQIQRLVYKEPFLSFAPEFIYRALPKCKIIYLIRDGRDCANSLVKSYGSLSNEKLKNFRTSAAPIGYLHESRPTPWWVESDQASFFHETSPYIRSIWMWKQMIQICNLFFSREDVILSERVLQVRYEDLVREPMSVGQTIADHFGVAFNKRFIRRLRKASSSSIGKYRSRDQSEIALAEKVAYNELKLHGYLN